MYLLISLNIITSLYYGPIIKLLSAVVQRIGAANEHVFRYLLYTDRTSNQTL